MRAPTRVLPRVRQRMFLALASIAFASAGVVPLAQAAHAAGIDVISGSVFQDQNRNGVRDAGEVGFVNLRVDLFDSAGINVAAAITDANGTYSLPGMADGQYTVAIDASAWTSYNDNWVMTNLPSPAPGYLSPQSAVSVSGSTTVDFPLRAIARSTTAPISTYTAPDGMTVQSYDDVVPANQLYAALQQAQFMGKAASPYTTISFDRGVDPNYTSYSCVGTPGAYTSYSDVTTLTYSGWRDQFDDFLFHEHGLEWGMYTACMVQQDLSLRAYLTARGLLGNPLIGTSYAWDPSEMLAEDYREVFGTANASSYPQLNTAIPLASGVPGLKNWLEYTFTAPPTTATPTSQPAPEVVGVTPGMGAAAGGSQVTISGANFAGSDYTVTSVSFGTQVAASFTTMSPSQVSAVAPAGSGSVDVTVTTQVTSGTQATSATSSADVFTYAPAPTVTSITPSSGSHRGGTVVSVHGTGFSGTGFTVTGVTFGSVTATKFTVLSPTALTAVAPAGSIGASVAIRVSTPGGSSASSSSCSFTYTKK